MSEDNTSDIIDQVLEEMSSEHEQLLQTVNEIKDAISSEHVNLAKQHLMQLQIQQQSHFDHEVGLMEQYEYPHIKDHKNNHDSLIEALYAINRLVNLENLQRLNGELSIYLDNSLRHIIEVDRPFQEFLSAFRDGEA